MRTGLLLLGALALGLGIAAVDARPAWDDTGMTAFALLLGAGIFGFLGPRRAWLWALAIGIWIPLHAFIEQASPASSAMLLVLAFPLTGAYAGAGVRYWMQRPAAGQ